MLNYTQVGSNFMSKASVTQEKEIEVDQTIEIFKEIFLAQIDESLAAFQKEISTMIAYYFLYEKKKQIVWKQKLHKKIPVNVAETEESYNLQEYPTLREFATELSANFDLRKSGKKITPETIRDEIESLAFGFLTADLSRAMLTLHEKDEFAGLAFTAILFGQQMSYSNDGIDISELTQKMEDEELDIEEAIVDLSQYQEFAFFGEFHQRLLNSVWDLVPEELVQEGKLAAMAMHDQDETESELAEIEAESSEELLNVLMERLETDYRTRYSKELFLTEFDKSSILWQELQPIFSEYDPIDLDFLADLLPASRSILKWMRNGGGKKGGRKTIFQKNIKLPNINKTLERIEGPVFTKSNSEEVEEFLKTIEKYCYSSSSITGIGQSGTSFHLHLSKEAGRVRYGDSSAVRPSFIKSLLKEELIGLMLRSDLDEIHQASGEPYQELRGFFINNKNGSFNVNQHTPDIVKETMSIDPSTGELLEIPPNVRFR